MKRLSVSLSQSEIAAGVGYLIFQQMFLGALLYICNSLVPKPLSVAGLNCLAFILNFAATLLIFHKFLWKNLQNTFKSLWSTLKWAMAGFGLYFAGSMLVSWLIVAIQPNFSNINDDTIGQMAKQSYTLMTICTVLLVPIAEECMYRGLVFSTLYRKNHIFGYAVSTLFFAGIHVVGYVGVVSPGTLGLCFLQYIPAGLSLAWAYAQADSIWAPILMHMTINQIGMLAGR